MYHQPRVSWTFFCCIHILWINPHIRTQPPMFIQSQLLPHNSTDYYYFCTLLLLNLYSHRRKEIKLLIRKFSSQNTIKKNKQTLSTFGTICLQLALTWTLTELLDASPTVQISSLTLCLCYSILHPFTASALMTDVWVKTLVALWVNSAWYATNFYN